MLNYLVIRGIAAVLTLIFGYIAAILWAAYWDTDCDSTVVFVLIYVFRGLAIISAIYYFCDCLIFNRSGDLMLDLIILFFIIVVVIAAFHFGTFMDSGECIRFNLGRIIVSIIIFIIALMIAVVMLKVDYNSEMDDIYDTKIIQQSPQVETYKYELIAASDGTNIEGSISGESSGDFFLACGTISSNINGEIKQVNVYKFYYVANSTTGEIKLMTLNADSTSIFYVEEGEEPYLLKKVSTPYSLDYNVDPPRKCNFGESKIVYELHILKGAIVGNFDFGSDN